MNVNKVKNLLFFIIIFLFSCEQNTEIPLPQNPLEKFALPKSIFTLTITPNPISASSPTQTWTIHETNKIGFDIEQIIVETYNQDSLLTRTYNFSNSEIISLFDSNYIPPSSTIIGTKNNDVNEPSGYWRKIKIIGTDENKNRVSTECVLRIQ